MAIDPNDFRKEKVAKLIAYEYEMMKFLFEADELGKYRSGTGYAQIKERGRVFACLESLLVHVRNLRDFFFLPPRNNDKERDTILAEYFVDDVNRWKKERDEVSDWDFIDRINKRLSHPTLARLSLPTDWHVDPIVETVDSLWNMFIGHVPPERQEWFANSDLLEG